MEGNIHFEKSFCGYANSEDSSFYAPMERVVLKIESMLANEKAVGAISEAASLKLFPASLEFAFSKLDDKGWWWVIDRFILLFGVRENKGSIPLVLDFLKKNRETLRENTSYNLITALDNMTGKSLRFANGNPKTLERSISDYLDWYATGFALEAR